MNASSIFGTAILNLGITSFVISFALLTGNPIAGAVAQVHGSYIRSWAVYSLDYARTRLANDAKLAKGGGARQFNGLVDVHKKTLASDGIVGIIVYCGLYFGVYDSLKPVVLVGALEGSFLASFALGWGVTIGGYLYRGEGTPTGM